jgi:hypothetical protein
MKHDEAGRSLTLYEIETGLLSMLEAREEATTDEERAAAEAVIRAYVTEEVRKVDNIRGFIRSALAVVGAAKDEAARQADRARVWQNKIDRLKAFVLAVMLETDTTRLDGRTGTLLVKGNGGLAPLIVNEEILPDEWFEYTIKIPGTEYLKLAASLSPVARSTTRLPRGADIREALALIEVPGARLEDRGKHLEVK